MDEEATKLFLDKKIKLKKPKGKTKRNDTFGAICFQGFGQEASRNAPYVRVSALKMEREIDEDIQSVLKLMKDHWKMSPPRLIVSVTGGAQEFFMKRRLLDGFKLGLMKVATTAGAWIITGGTKTGVMEMVGEAAREHVLRNGLAEQNIVLLGVVPWSMVANKECLVSGKDQAKGHFPCNYNIKDIPDDNASSSYERPPAPVFDLRLMAGPSDTRNTDATTAPPGEQSRTNVKITQRAAVTQRCSSLDPNHTHFVLVDNPNAPGYGEEIEYRAKLEQEISSSTVNRLQGGTTRAPVRPVPTVLLVLEGGQGTLKTVREMIVKNIPVVVIAGSGRAADLLDYAVNNRQPWISSDPRVFDETARLLGIKLDLPDTERVIKNRATVEKCIAYVKDIVDMKYQDLLTIYRQTDEDFQHDIDEAVIYALIKAQKNESNKPDITGQLELALAWNRADIAKKEILTPERRSEWKDEEVLNKILLDALVQDKHEFAFIVVDSGVVLKKFLTIKRLKKLYEAVLVDRSSGISADILRNLMHEAQQASMGCGSKPELTEIHMETVGRVINSLTKDQRQNVYSGNRFKGQQSEKALSKPDNSQADLDEDDRPMYVEYPERELFLWALLLNRKDLALLFWKLGGDHIGGALTASMLSQSLSEVAEQDEELDLAEQLRNDSIEYESLATGVLNECYQLDKSTSHKLLVRDLNMWGNKTLYVLANSSYKMDFMEHTSCQTLLNKIWKGKMALSTPIWKILIGLIMPLICFTVKFTSDDTDRGGKGSRNEVKPVSDDVDNIAADNGVAMTTIVNGDTDRIANGGGDNGKEPTRNKRRKLDFLTGNNFLYALYYYYTAPIVKFCYCLIAYLVFLGLFSFFVLTDLVPSYPSVYEYIVWAWALTFVAEQLREFLSDESPSLTLKFASYFRGFWRRVDQFINLLLVVSVILRYTLTSSDFVWARMFYVSTLSMFFLRFLQFFYVEKNIGPKVLMIRRMLNDLAFFLLILVVFLFAFGIAAQALLYPNSAPTWNLLFNVVYQPYFDIYGQLNSDEFLGQSSGTCSSNASIYESDPSISECPTETGLGLFMLAVYLLLVNILLINLLIAMFSFTFSKVQDNSEKVWRFYRFGLVDEYYYKPPLAPPLIIICHIYLLLRFIYRKCKHQEHINTDFRQHLKTDENARLTAFERAGLEAFYLQQRRAEQDQIDYKLTVTTQRMEHMILDVEHLREHASRSNGPTLVNQRKAESDVTMHECNCKEELSRVEQQLLDQQAQLAAILQAINNVSAKRQLGVFGEKTSAPHIEIKDFDFGSTTT